MITMHLIIIFLSLNCKSDQMGEQIKKPSHNYMLSQKGSSEHRKILIQNYKGADMPDILGSHCLKLLQTDARAHQGSLGWGYLQPLTKMEHHDPLYARHLIGPYPSLVL
jgi:hypothetical protein